MVTLLKVVGYGWCALVVLCALVGLIGVFVSEGLSGVASIFVRFHVAHWLLIPLLLTPGFMALGIAEKLKTPKKLPDNHPTE